MLRCKRPCLLTQWALVLAPGGTGPRMSGLAPNIFTSRGNCLRVLGSVKPVPASAAIRVSPSGSGRSPGLLWPYAGYRKALGHQELA